MSLCFLYPVYLCYITSQNYLNDCHAIVNLWNTYEIMNDIIFVSIEGTHVAFEPITPVYPFATVPSFRHHMFVRRSVACFLVASYTSCATCASGLAGTSVAIPMLLVSPVCQFSPVSLLPYICLWRHLCVSFRQYLCRHNEMSSLYQ